VAPRFALGWAALVYALATLAYAYPALGGGFLVTPFSDQYIAGYAFREFAAASLKTAGEFPQWNPYQFGGMPYIAAMHGDIFYPTFLLRLLLPTDVAMTWGFILHVFLAGLFSFAFLRAWGFGFVGALVGGLAYMLGGNVAGLVSPGHDGKLFISALLPLALLLLTRGIRDGRNWAWGPLALTVGLAVLSPHPQLLQYMLLAGGFFALFLGFADLGGGALPRRTAIGRIAIALGAVAVGGLIGAIQYLPVREYVPFSPRAGGTGWEHAVSYSLPPEELINTYLPQFSGILEGYWGRNGIHFHSEYIGASVLVLATLAFGWSVTQPRRKWVWFWAGTFIVTLLWAMGGFTPFYHLIYAIVPGTKYFRAPSTILYIVSFSTAMLAAAGTERLLANVPVRRLVIWLAVALLVALLATSGGLTNFAATLADPRRADLVFTGKGELIAGAWRSFFAVAVVVGIGVALARGRLPARTAGWALALVVGADLWSVVRQYWNFTGPASEIYRSDPAIDHLRRIDQPARVLVGALEPLTARDPYLGPLGGGTANLMVHRIRTVFGYHGNELGRYQTLYSQEGALANPNFWKLTNTQFFLTNVGEIPIPGSERLVGPVTNPAGETMYLFRLPGDNPFAWVAPAIVKAADDEILATVLDPRFDVRTVAIFDSSATAVQGAALSALPQPAATTVRTSRYAPGEIDLELSVPAAEGSALVVSENYYPGWSASVDGRAVPLGRVDYTFIGVPLPAGARRVELRFDSPSYETGKLITLLALTIAVAGWVAGAMVDRRRRG
jgi:hypothetical protein